ncbi:unnamed protein product [Lactuca virosa]|uniref:Uncharacterized protein n=1 Tax=Lactuca virosa TaxID=75947 RepID=A0AAU9MVC1_9ASTR|nr:unnamed protein product [Lactuca virosa]
MDIILPSLYFQIEEFILKVAAVQEAKHLAGGSFKTNAPEAILHEVFGGSNSRYAGVFAESIEDSKEGTMAAVNKRKCMWESVGTATAPNGLDATDEDSSGVRFVPQWNLGDCARLYVFLVVEEYIRHAFPPGIIVDMESHSLADFIGPL